MAGKIRKFQIKDWQEVADAQQSATDANALATGAKSTADSAVTTAGTALQKAINKIAFFVKFLFIATAENTTLNGYTFTVESSAVQVDDIIDVELYENGVCNDTATIAYVGGGSVASPTTVFTVTGLENAIQDLDRYKFSIAVRESATQTPGVGGTSPN